MSLEGKSRCQRYICGASGFNAGTKTQVKTKTTTTPPHKTTTLPCPAFFYVLQAEKNSLQGIRY
jgi:hypothetical protein